MNNVAQMATAIRQAAAPETDLEQRRHRRPDRPMQINALAPSVGPGARAAASGLAASDIGRWHAAGDLGEAGTGQNGAKRHLQQIGHLGIKLAPCADRRLGWAFSPTRRGNAVDSAMVLAQQAR